MNLADDILMAGTWPAVALLQVTLLALVGYFGWLAARHGGPALRAAVLSAALVGLLLVPALAVVAPVWLPLPEGVGLSSAGPAAAGPGDSAPTFRPLPRSTPASLAPDEVLPPGKSAPAPVHPGEQVADATLPPASDESLVFPVPGPTDDSLPVGQSSEPSGPAWTVPGVLVGVWLLGALVCLARALGRLVLLYRCARRSRPITDEDWMGCMHFLGQRYGSAAALRESGAVTSPLTLGLFWPVILVPLGRRHWSSRRRALILGHELAHVRRHDFLAGLVAELAACLCWFHPLVRWLAGRLRLEQEYAADAWVVSATAGSMAYLRCLARLALEQGRGHGSLAPALGRRRPEILRRIDMLRRHPRGLPHHLGKRAGWAVTALAAAACLAVAGVGPLHSAADARPPAEPGADAKAQVTADAHGDLLPPGALARLGTTRLRHAAEVTYVMFGPDGKTVVTAGRDGTIRLWDLGSGKEIRRFARPKAAAPKPLKGDVNAAIMLMGGRPNDPSRFCVALTPDGKMLAAGSGSSVQLWEVETGKALRKIEGLPSGLTGLLFSPNGQTLAGRTSNGTLFLWTAATGKEIRRITPPARPQGNTIVLAIGGGGADAPGMAFTPDSKALAAAATDYQKDKTINSVKLWDVATGREIQQIKSPGAGVSAVAVGPSGRLAYAGGGVIHLCAVDSGKEVRQVKMLDSGVAALVFSLDGKTLAARGRNQKVRLWETQTGKELQQLADAEPAARRTGGNFVILGSGFSGPEMRALALSPDGKRLASASGSTVRLWDTATGQELPLLGGHRRAPSAVIVSTKDKVVVSWGADRVLRRWDAATGRPLGAVPAPPGTTLAALSADGRTAALANGDNSIRLLETATGRELHRLKGHPGGAAALAFAPDGKVLASRGGDNTLRLFDVAQGTELRRITLRLGKAQPQPNVIVLGGPARDTSGPGLAFSPDGKLVVAAGAGNTLVFFDVLTGKEMRKIESPQRVSSVAFTPDGRTLATENADRTITLWEVASAQQQGRLGKPASARPERVGAGMALNVVVDGLPGVSAEPSGPVGLTFSPDGRALAARGPDGSIRMWDVIATKEIRQIQGHTGRVETVAFASDGRTLASGATDTTILLWDLADLRKALAAPSAAELPAAEVEALWGDLTGPDAAKALRGVLKLAGSPRQTVPFLRERLKPAARVDQRLIDGWIADLQSDKFAVREQASAGLLKVGAQAVPALRKVLAAPPSLEMRYRAEMLLDKLTSGTLTAEQLRLVRAVEALERMPGQEARTLLETLAQGAPGELPTREAQAALDRLARALPR
jgi:WD40 repeat protein/beta-lactamase regulating signal transducer with metallopeptidase domain